MKMKAVAVRSASRSVRASSASALTAQTKADHAHHTKARASIARPNPAHLWWPESSVVTWVTANTNTRSHRSSIGDVRRSATPSPGMSVTARSMYGDSGSGRSQTSVGQGRLTFRGVGCGPGTGKHPSVVVVASHHAHPAPAWPGAELADAVWIAGALATAGGRLVARVIVTLRRV